MLDQVSFDRKPDCYGIRQITDDEGVEEWEDIRTSPDVAREEANDMMATGRGERYEVVPLWTTPQPAPAPLSDDVVRDAMRFRDLYRMTALLETPAGNAYQDAMESEMAIAFKEAGSDLTKISIEQYRRVIDAGFAAATLAAQGGKV